ncbi:SCO4848 family membrane protein [Kineococcus sp. SYSU DK005]|uniref:SCO4848 family membrane protein n=1 Tax=Kineococcus sp. SYSU DK005 TaxID=3383126 RepID=UPI003D7D1FB4
MVLSRRTSAFLAAFGLWSWFIWPNFLRNIWNDPRSFEDGPQPFFLVHLVLVVVSLALGTTIAVVGVRGLRASRRRR